MLNKGEVILWNIAPTPHSPDWASPEGERCVLPIFVLVKAGFLQAFSTPRQNPAPKQSPHSPYYVLKNEKKIWNQNNSIRNVYLT